MADYKISKGYTVPIVGDARQEIADLPNPPFLGVTPIEFPDLKIKLTVQVNDEVKVGTPLYFNKKRPEQLFLSPASGRVTAINYGPRRVIEEIVIATGDKTEYESFDKHAKNDIAKLKRDKLIEKLLAGGVWNYIKQRPFNRVADPQATPKGIFVNCMSTAPLGNDPNFSLNEQGTAFEAGIEALKVLCDKVHVCMRAENPSAVFRSAQGVSTHTFSGKHPAGLTGTHINRVDPINKGDAVWCLKGHDVVALGSFLLEGKYPTERIVAIAGPGCSNPRYLRARLGMKVKDIVSGSVAEGEQRFISGDILSGLTRAEDGYLGFYDDLITIIPEGREQHFLGWMGPGTRIPSFTRTYLTGFMGSKRFKMNTNLNGGHRAIIQSGVYEKVMAIDVFPEHLTKAAIAGDIDAMERLGILECDPEDFALCTYLCPSKTEVSNIIAEGLELMEKEG